ncbi:MAG: UPF0755 protein [Dokdonia sp.]|jgi:UPF0755 protein
MAKKKSNIKLILGSILSMALIVGLLFGYHFYRYIYASNVKMETDQKIFVIESDWTYEKVARSLLENRIISNAESFDWVAKKKRYTTHVKSGRFQIQNGWSNTELINHIRLAGNSSPVKVTFHTISRLSQLAAIVGNQIEADSAELMEAFLDSDWMSRYGVTKQTAQAIFIPNTYELYWNTSGRQFTKRMTQEFDHFWTVERKEKAKTLNLSPIEVSILASIVEAETKKNDEMPKVAGLYLNRLKIGMRLQSDPTVVFALNKPGIHRVYFADLKIESPYNTYIYKGLPPGPIGFPSTKALNAVLDSFESKYIYMCAKPDYSGYHNFANSYNQHLRYAAKYRAFLKRQGIR